MSTGTDTGEEDQPLSSASSTLDAYLPWAAKVVSALQLFAAACLWFYSELSKVQLSVSVALTCAVVLELVVLLILMFSRPTLPYPMSDDETFSDAITASGQFLRLWNITWYTWVIFYMLYAVERVVVPGLPPQYASLLGTGLHLGRDAANLVTACFLFLSYETMVMPSTGKFLRHYKDNIGRALTVCIVLIFAECGALLVSSSSKNLGDLAIVHTWFDGLNGIVSGVAVALLVGRFESRLMNASIFVIITLYTWAVIQPGYLVFGGDAAATLFLVSIAFVGKVVLFDEIRKQTSSGNLVFYMSEYRAMRLDNMKRQTFFQTLLKKQAPEENDRA